MACAITMLIAMLIGYACTKPTSFGGDLLDDQLADYEYTDTITMNCTLVREDNTLTTSDINTAPYLLCGEILDPVFGKVRADIYTLFAPTSFNPDFNKANATLDSVVMYLGYDVSGVYGDTSQQQTIRVFKLTEQIKNDSSYKMTRTLPVGEEVGSITYRPQPTRRDSLTSSNKGPFLRIPLTAAYAAELKLLDRSHGCSSRRIYIEVDTALGDICAVSIYQILKELGQRKPILTYILAIHPFFHWVTSKIAESAI